MEIGARYAGDGETEFIVWAPLAEGLELMLPSRVVPMQREQDGYWRAVAGDAPPGTEYLYRINGERERPDPASSFQPQGVHGPSQVLDHSSFRWEDDHWRGISLREMVIYEVHIGTFTPEGTFDAAAARVEELLDLGVNALEIMPVAQFPGERNWGYDGVYPFSVQNSYGGPEGLKRLVNECHRKGVAVVLDVVYNHLGHEGNYLQEYGPYFTDRYLTPWGRAVNFDGAYSDGVRNFFIQNALHWFRNYHIDALRLDAVHAIFDMSARHFLAELSDRVRLFSRREGRPHLLIAESDLNDSRLIRPTNLCGHGIDALWCDDFHHSLHVLLTGEKDGYYVDFGGLDQMVKALREGFVYTGEYSVFRKRRHGNSSKDHPPERFVVFAQNHDQVGNRMLGERLSSLVCFESLKLAAGVVLCSPYVPLLFMGEEYGEEAPFPYFVSHSDQALIEAVRQGRKEEFRSFRWKGEPPDPQSVETFLRAKIHWEKRRTGRHRVLLHLYRALIRLRRDNPVLSVLDRERMELRPFEAEGVIAMRRWRDGSQVLCIFNFSRSDRRLTGVLPAGRWRRVLDSSDVIWGGPGSLLPERVSAGDEIGVRGRSFTVLSKEDDH